MFKKDSEQSIVFIFEFPTLLSLKSSYIKLQKSFGVQEPNIRENKDGSFQLRLTRIILYNEANILKHKEELIEDLTDYGGKFINFKVHKVVKGGVLKNKEISTFIKVYTFLSKIGGTKAYKTYDVPLYTVLFIIFIIIVVSALKI